MDSLQPSMEKQFCGTHYDPDELGLFIQHLDECFKLRGSNRLFKQRFDKITLVDPGYTIMGSGACRHY